VSAEDALGLCPRKTEKVKPRDVQKIALRIRKEVSTVTTNAANTNTNANAIGLVRSEACVALHCCGPHVQVRDAIAARRGSDADAPLSESDAHALTKAVRRRGVPVACHDASDLSIRSRRMPLRCMACAPALRCMACAPALRCMVLLSDQKRCRASSVRARVRIIGCLSLCAKADCPVR
jgi:hypothetical protein